MSVDDSGERTLERAFIQWSGNSDREAGVVDRASTVALVEEEKLLLVGRQRILTPVADRLLLCDCRVGRSRSLRGVDEFVDVRRERTQHWVLEDRADGQLYLEPFANLRDHACRKERVPA